MYLEGVYEILFGKWKIFGFREIYFRELPNFKDFAKTYFREFTPIRENKSSRKFILAKIYPFNNLQFDVFP